MQILEDDRERALFLMFATTGLRKSEVLNLKIEDINLKKEDGFAKGPSWEN